MIHTVINKHVVIYMGQYSYGLHPGSQATHLWINKWDHDS